MSSKRDHETKIALANRGAIFKGNSSKHLNSIFTYEKRKMNNKGISIALLVVGIILLFLAYQSSQGLDDQVTEAVTGNFTNSTIWFLILGIVSAVTGVGMLLLGGTTRRN